MKKKLNAEPKEHNKNKNKNSLWRNPEKAKYTNVTCFDLLLDRKEIRCRYCHKSAELRSKFLSEAAPDIIAFKKKHTTCAKRIKKRFKPQGG